MTHTQSLSERLRRDELGRIVREAWVRWAQTQPNPKPSWLVPYDELAEADKEADRQIGEAVARKAADALDAKDADKDEAYRQRNHLVAALARIYPSGIRATDIEGWDPEWHGCVFIDLPSGQISYHYHNSQAHLFARLPPYTKEWDGHDKETVHTRLAALKPRLAALKPLTATKSLSERLREIANYMRDASMFVRDAADAKDAEIERLRAVRDVADLLVNECEGGRTPPSLGILAHLESALAMESKARKER